ncbi:MAG: ATP-dependent Clp protease ATP-binding subunit ClpC [Planctomycetota bacterium]
MRSTRNTTVYKYLDLADRFVRVRMLEPENVNLHVASGMNRSAYRQSVIRVCMEEFEETDMAVELQRLHPCDPTAAEDHLYQLCVSVNPGLEIHAVSLADELRSEEQVTKQRKKPSPKVALASRLARRSSDLQARLSERVIGQADAVQTVCASVRRAAAGLADDSRPLGSFLFVGRSGTGKTELCRALAAEVMGDEDSFVRVDCTEFAMAHEYSKLIGAPPGYVGHGDGGQLTEALTKNPECIVLFDEIEKAHPRMHNLLLQILEEGHLTDGKGQRVSFDRAFIVLTSNVGAQDVVRESNRVGFGADEQMSDVAVGEIVHRELAENFPPEFLGRLDETVLFRCLDHQDARKIAQRQLLELAMRVRKRGRRVAFTPAVAGWVAEKGFAVESGAREIRRAIRRSIEGPLAEVLLDTKRERPWIRIGIRAGTPELRIEE